MILNHVSHPVSHAHGEQSYVERRQYRVIYGLGFGVFLVAAALGRLAFWNGSSDNGQMSLLEEARSSTERSIPFAFMGW